MQAIYIIWLRQLKRYLRSKARIVGSLGQPILFLVALGFGLGPVFQKSGNGNYFDFLVPGVIAMGILFTAVFSGIEIIWDRQFGFLKETLVAPVSRLKIMIGRTLGGATVAMIQGVVVFILAFVVGFRPENLNLITFFLAFLFMFLIAILFTALGTAIASPLNDMQGFQLIMNFVVMPLFFLSGAFFPVQNLPIAMAVIVRIDPLSYGVDGLRYALTGATQFGWGADLGVLAAITAFLVILGSYMFSKIQI
jgi:ABC-2 type transport system permease protein